MIKRGYVISFSDVDTNEEHHAPTSGDYRLSATSTTEHDLVRHKKKTAETESTSGLFM